MKIQFRRLLSYLELLPIDVYGIDNVEADDVIAYLSQSIFKKEVIITLILVSTNILYGILSIIQSLDQTA